MKDMETLYEEMKESFAAETGMELSDSGDMAVRLRAAAAQIYALLLQSEWVLNQCFPQTAAGDMLDRHAEMRGLARRQAVPAVGVIRFYVDEAAAEDREIPAGTVCMTAGLVRFETTEDAVLAKGELSVDVPAQALEAGTGGNVSPETVVRMAAPPVGIAGCRNTEAFSGGLDSEEDEDLRERVLETFRRMPNGANAAFYEQEAAGFDRVAAARAIPRKRGIGTVDVVVATAEGIPDEELLEEIRADLQEKREIAVDVLVKGPEAVTVNVSAQVTAEAGADPETVKESAEANIRALFDGRMLGKDLLRAELGHRLYETEGAANYVLTEPAADVAITEEQLPRLGTLSVEVTA